MCMHILNAQVNLSSDFTNQDSKKTPIPDIWGIANRISPKNGAGVRADLKVNLVRMIGGINKTVNGIVVPDLDFDPCHYDEETGTYTYNWDVLIDRLDKIVNSDVEIHQIVMDQPPWAFQQGYTFIPEGTRDNVNFRENERMSIYGNSLPPFDKEAYFDFIAALMTKLVETYGEEKVLSWRFRIGSEIETPEHWYGTEQDFIEHFENSLRAIRSVLPNAKVGLHTREPGFVFRNAAQLNYKGEVIDSFIEALIEHTYDNNLRYDFWGISDYVRLNNRNSRTMNTKYEALFAPLVTHPKWNKNATLDNMEYTAIVATNPPDGKGFLSCVSSHREVIELAFAHQFYKNEDKGIESIFRWGNRPGTTNAINIEMANTMVGKTRYETQISGTPKLSSNELEAIFSKDENRAIFDVIIYNYNASSINYREEEPVVVSFTTDLPVGTILNYRYLKHGKDENKLQNFLKNEPASGWVKNGFSSNGDPSRILNESGLVAWNNFTNPTISNFTEWTTIATQSRTDGKEGSMVTINTELASFEFKKLEFRTLENSVTTVNTPQYIWTTNEDFEQFSKSQFTSTISEGILNTTITGNFPNLIYNSSFNVDSFGSFKIVLKNTTNSNLFWFVWYKDGVKKQLRFRPEVNETDFNTHTVNLNGNSSWNGTIDSFTIEVANRSSLGGTVAIERIELVLKDGVQEHSIQTNTEGAGVVSPSGGTAFTGQEITFTANAISGWEFKDWSGAVTSATNPLQVTITEDIELNAVFTESVLSTNQNKQLEAVLLVYPNPSEKGVFKLKSFQKWEVYTVTGVKIATGAGTELNLSNFARGIYLLKKIKVFFTTKKENENLIF